MTDYGAFRDLQRHRLCTIDWQALSVAHGFTQPEAIVEAGGDAEWQVMATLSPMMPSGDAEWQAVMTRCAELSEALVAAGLPQVAQYAVPMAYRVRFIMDMNAREAMHVIELRTAPQGHPAYRRVCQQMHTLISAKAGHHAIAESMKYADHSVVELERLQEERRLEKKRSGQ